MINQVRPFWLCIVRFKGGALVAQGLHWAVGPSSVIGGRRYWPDVPQGACLLMKQDPYTWQLVLWHRSYGC